MAEEDATQVVPVAKAMKKGKGKAMKKGKGKGKAKAMKRVLAEGEEPPPKKPKAEPLRKKVLNTLEEMGIDEAMKQAKDRLKAASAAVAAMEAKKNQALAESTKEQGATANVQKQVEEVVEKSQVARENANKGRIAVIEAAKQIVELKKEASERHKELQVVEEELKSGNKAAALKDAKENLQAAKRRMQEAKEREKTAIAQVKEREKEALQKVAADRVAEREQQAIIRKKDQEKNAEIRRLALEEKHAAKAASMISKTRGADGKAASPGKRVSQDID